MLVRGKIIHWYDCTVCKHRRQLQRHQKGKARMVGYELCELTGGSIPQPFSGHRWCDAYQNAGCPCERCNAPVIERDGAFIIQMDNTIDRVDEVC